MKLESLSRPPSQEATDANVIPLPRQEKLQRARGAVRLAFKQAGKTTSGRSRIDDLFQKGCLKARLPRIAALEPEAVLINTAGGLTDRDHLSIEAVWGPGSGAVVTTQACERIYKSRAEAARVETRLTVEEDASAFWLPQETILFDGGRLDRRAEVSLTGKARLLACEAVIFGRPAMGETVRSGFLRDTWRIERDGELLFLDRLGFEGDIAAQLDRQAVGNSARALASVIVCAPDTSGLCDLLRPLLDRPGITGGCSDLGRGVVLARMLAPSGYRLRATLTPLLERLRGGELPRVWTC